MLDLYFNTLLILFPRMASCQCSSCGILNENGTSVIQVASLLCEQQWGEENGSGVVMRALIPTYLFRSLIETARMEITGLSS